MKKTKKHLALLLAVSITLLSLPLAALAVGAIAETEKSDSIALATVSGDEFTYGDVNNDGSVNSDDYEALAKYIANWSGYTESNINLKAADLNNDGNVNTLDRVILARHIAKWIDYTKLPYSEDSDRDAMEGFTPWE